MNSLRPYVYYAGRADREVSAMSRRMAEQVDVPYMVKSDVASGGAYNYAASQGIPSILIERGGMGGWNSEEVRSTRRDVRIFSAIWECIRARRITGLIIRWR